MGASGISPGSLIIILLIMVMFFGTQRLKSMSQDLGEAIKSFRKGLEDHDESSKTNDPSTKTD